MTRGTHLLSVTPPIPLNAIEWNFHRMFITCSLTHSYCKILSKLFSVFTWASFVNTCMGIRETHLLYFTFPVLLNWIIWNFHRILITYSHCAPPILDLIWINLGVPQQNMEFVIRIWEHGGPISYLLLLLYNWTEFSVVFPDSLLHVLIVHFLFKILIQINLEVERCIWSNCKWGGIKLVSIGLCIQMYIVTGFDWSKNRYWTECCTNCRCYSDCQSRFLYIRYM